MLIYKDISLSPSNYDFKSSEVDTIKVNLKSV